MVVEKRQRLISCGRLQPQSQLGEFYCKGILVNPVQTVFDYSTLPVQQGRFVTERIDVWVTRVRIRGYFFCEILARAQQEMTGTH